MLPDPNDRECCFTCGIAVQAHADWWCARCRTAYFAVGKASALPNYDENTSCAGEGEL